MQIFQTVRLLSPLLRLYPWVIPGIVVLGILSSLSEGIGISLFIPLLQGLIQPGASAISSIPFVDFFSRSLQVFPEEQQFAGLVLLIFISIVLKSGLTYSNMILFSWFNSRVTHRLRSGIFQQFLTVNASFLESNESGKLMNTLATETWQTGRALNVLVGLIIDICTVVVFVSLLMLISLRLTLLVAIAMIVTSIVIQFVTRQTKHLGQQAVKANKTLSDRMWEGFSGMRVIRAFNRETYEQERFDRASKSVRDVFFRLDVLSGVVNPLSELLAAGLLLGILAIALTYDRTTLPTLLTFLFILLRLQPKAKQIDASRVGMASLTGSIAEVMDLLDTSDKPYIRSGTVPFSGLQQAISIDAVSFRYAAENRPALEAFSLQIPRGKTTALVGPSGAGKSTLIGLLCRFYQPTSGEIYVDGVPLPQLNLSDWRSRIAIVSQDVYMFSTTIRENIAYGRLDATDDEIIEAAKLANAHDFITQFPNGYETKVGDRGFCLSGGQRQRLALARAIVRNPDILILDEATNALDTFTETLIQEALDRLSRDRTVIVIAHRLSTIEQADQIAVLENGRLVEQGNLSQLLKQDGLFAKLHRLQFRSAQVQEQV